MAGLSISNVEKSFGSTQVLKGVSLEIADGEFIALVGPSGCGKSTLLRIIAGLESQDAGTISIGEELIDAQRASQRNLAMVFQSYALYPHLTVEENISVPLRMRRLNGWQRLPIIGQFMPGARAHLVAIHQQVLAAAETLGLAALLKRKPGQLSGGQRQRVAVGRAMVRDPQAFLLDEPLSNLDAKLRVHMRTEITELHRKLGATFVYVTHDQAEAMTMSDRIAVMMDGALQQLATPSEIYHRPVNIRVAEFIGSPKINILPASFGDRLIIAGSKVPFECNDARVSVIGLRPEALSIVAADGALQGRVSHVENFGAEAYFHVQLPEFIDRLVVRGAPSLLQTVRIGSTVQLAINPQEALIFDAEGQRLPAKLSYAAQREYA
jgi:multiple sugar transport system ATP-binding protein